MRTCIIYETPTGIIGSIVVYDDEVDKAILRVIERGDKILQVVPLPK